jgi:hypothetical protein
MRPQIHEAYRWRHSLTRFERMLLELRDLQLTVKGRGFCFRSLRSRNYDKQLQGDDLVRLIPPSQAQRL